MSGFQKMNFGIAGTGTTIRVQMLLLSLNKQSQSSAVFKLLS